MVKSPKHSVKEPGGIIAFIKANQTIPPCIMIPRLRYGSKESIQEQVHEGIPLGWNKSMFQTMRFRHHAPLHNHSMNRFQKAIVDV